MLARRIIPCLDVKDGRVVKGIKFQGLRDAGLPEEQAEKYEEDGADELVFLDVSATDEGRKTQYETVRKVRAVLSIPMTVGGGVSVVEDAARLLEAGADKVSINTAAVNNPGLLKEMAEKFGSQCTVLAIDAKQMEKGKWQTVIKAGKVETGKDVIEWAKEAVALGCGEILLTSWDRDGTRSGYDLELVKAVSDAVNVPVIASGGANTPEQMIEAIKAGADAVLAASIFHDGDTTPTKLKQYLKQKNIEVRL